MNGKQLKGLVNVGMTYVFLALASGVFYREFTRYYDYTGETDLSIIHVHLMVLGFFAYMMFLAFSLNTNLLEIKKFKIFRKIYNVGLIMMIATIFAKGVMQVKGMTLSKAITASISGVSGISHSILTASFILFFLALKEMKVYRDGAETKTTLL